MVIARGIASLGFALAVATPAGATTPTFPDTAIGDWSGTVQLKGAERHLFVHIHRTPTGCAASLDSPEHQVGAVPATPIAAPDGALAFAADGGEFRGVWSETGGRWEGTWTEAGATGRITLSFNDNSSVRRLRSTEGTSPVLTVPPSLPRVGFPADVVPPSAR